MENESTTLKKIYESPESFTEDFTKCKGLANKLSFVIYDVIGQLIKRVTELEKQIQSQNKSINGN